MASLLRDKRTEHSWRYEPVISGKRLRFSFKARAQKTAERTVLRIDELIEAVVHRVPLEGELLRWLETVDKRLFKQLVRAGLVRERQGHTIQSLTDAYLKSKGSSIKPRTIVSIQQAQTNLIQFFGSDRDIATVTPGDADEFKSFLKSPRKVTLTSKSGEKYEREMPGLATATVQRRMRNAKTFFTFAKRKKFLLENPFEDVKTTQQGNPSRMFFVDAGLSFQVLDALPNAEWRLFFSLLRWGGLRFHEALLLTWDDIVEDRQIIMVNDEKRASQGKPVRKIPLYTEIEPHLSAVWESLPEGTAGTALIFENFCHGKNPNQYLTNYFLRHLKRAGITPWPKIFQNLRATRATEMRGFTSAHFARSAMGHTEKVAEAHYLQILDEDYDNVRKASYQKTIEAQKKAAAENQPQSDAFTRKFTRTRHSMDDPRQTAPISDTNKKPRETKPGVSVDAGNCGRPDGRKTLSSRPGRT